MEAELLARWPDAAVELVEGKKGIFDVHVDGALVFSKYDEGRHAKPGEIVKRLEDRGL